jgi:hypothetical protein
LRAGAGASVVGTGVALSLATWVSSKASGEAVGGCDSFGVAGAADFGCHFLRSGREAAGSVADVGALVGVDGVDGTVSEMEGAVGL